MQTEVRKAKMKAEEEQSFNEFLAKPETKLMLSMIPASENPDAMKTLLRCSFDAGVGAGSASVLGGLIDAMFKKPKDL